MIWLMVVVLPFGVARLSMLLCADDATQGVRGWLARRYPPSTRPLMHEETGTTNGGATLAPHPLVALLTRPRYVTAWGAALAVVAAHLAGLLGPWKLAPFVWVGVAGAALLLAQRDL